MANQITAIFPYCKGGMWMFDDPAVGLREELFVSGIDTIIALLTKDIPKAEDGFRLTFSGSPFPGVNVVMEHMEQDRTAYLPAIPAKGGRPAVPKMFIPPAQRGNWYRHTETGMEGWLCPALLKYFDDAPLNIYVKLEADPDQAAKLAARKEANRLNPLRGWDPGNGWGEWDARDNDEENLEIVPGPLDTVRPQRTESDQATAEHAHYERPNWWNRARGRTA